MNRHLARRHLAIAAAIVTMTAAAGCGGTPGSSPDSGGATPSGAVKTTGFDKLGPVNLTIWSYDNQDPGLEPVLKQLSARLREAVPEREDQPGLQGLQQPRRTSSRGRSRRISGPDITEGNQGYQTDAQLVKAKLIVPLDPYIKAYGWDKWYSPSTWSMFRWTTDGKTFGKGPTWGVAQTGQNIDVYVNKKKLQQLGFDPANMPQTFDDFNKMLADVRAKLPKSDPVIEFGNKEGYGTIHMFGGIQGAYVSAQDDAQLDLPRARARRWDTPDNIKALAAYQSWAKNGYFNSDYNALKYDAVRGRVRQGQGRLLDRRRLGLVDHQGRPRARTSAVMQHPAGTERRRGPASAASPARGTSRPRRSTRTSAAAWLNYIIASPEAQKLMFAQQQIPSPSDAATPPAGDPYLGQVTDAFRQVADDDGLMLYTDWASPTMYDDAGVELPGPARRPHRGPGHGEGRAGRLGEVRQDAPAVSVTDDHGSGAAPRGSRRPTVPARTTGRPASRATSPGSTSCRDSCSTGSSRSRRSLHTV